MRELYKGRLLVLDLVLEELMRNRTIAPHVENFLRFKVIEEYSFPSKDEEILKEYALLRKTKGKGESACMAVCRYQNNILASSNLRDIKPYCEHYGIAYLTTMDILSIAYKKEFLIDACHRIARTPGRQTRSLPERDLHFKLNVIKFATDI